MILFSVLLSNSPFHSPSLAIAVIIIPLQSPSASKEKTPLGGKKMKKISPEELKETVLRGITAYEREVKDLHMILFPEILDHIVRLDRVLSTDGGSLLMVGKSGVGRRSGVALTSHIQGMKFFTPNMSRGYAAKSFKIDLKQVLQVGGIEVFRTYIYLSIYLSIHLSIVLFV